MIGAKQGLNAISDLVSQPVWKESIIPGKYTIRYCAELECFGRAKLEEIAETVAHLPRWDDSSVKANPDEYDGGEKFFEFQGEISAYMGIQFIAFPISGLHNELVIAIDSRKNFEAGVRDLKDLAVKVKANDGQHRHGTR